MEWAPYDDSGVVLRDQNGFPIDYIAPGKVRIKWTCQCGKSLWDDYLELRPGAAADLQKQLDVNERIRVQSSSSEENANAVKTSRASSHMTEPVDKKFLLLCFRKPGDAIRLYQLDITEVNNDVQLFRIIKNTFTTHQGLLGRLLFSRTIDSIAFRKFERHPRERVMNISRAEALPKRNKPIDCHEDHQAPKCDTTYDISTKFTDLKPYLAANELEHLLQCPYEGEEEGNNIPAQTVWLERFPKKLKSKLTPCPPYQYGIGWGLVIEATWYINWLTIISLLALFSAAIIFFISWWVFRGDIQGASGGAAFFLTFAGIIIGVFSLRNIARP